MVLHLLKPRLVRALSTSSDKFELYGGLPIPPNKQRLVPTSGNYPFGFKVGSIRAGIKPASNTQPDLVLVSSDRPATGAAVFTKNEFCAPSITVSRAVMRQTKGHGLRGVIANSGCANLLTGQQGLDDATAMSREVCRQISGRLPPGADDSSSVMVMHTGMGARRLPINNILSHVPKLCQEAGSSHEQWLQAAVGLCTTDTFPKLASRTFTLPSSPTIDYSIAGLTKGAGMIHPNMATTLGIICTDASVTPDALQALLRSSAAKSYNCISIDGDTSTNDMVAMFANGAANPHQQKTVNVSSSPSDDFIAFQRVLDDFMADMAKLVVRDAEGATKFMTIRVRGSPSYEAAKLIASAIARSVLVKTAIYGGDPNWGGILVALGYALVDSPFAGQGIILPEQTSVSFVDGHGLVKFLDRGVPVAVDGGRVKKIMEMEDLEAIVDLRDGVPHDGATEAVYWTCDMTNDFISMNSGA